MHEHVHDRSHPCKGAHLGQVVTLMGQDGEEAVSAEMWGDWLGSIHYGQSAEYTQIRCVFCVRQKGRFALWRNEA